ncbi:hypothetical protein KI387_027707, partial [Taxus chinensis]
MDDVFGLGHLEEDWGAHGCSGKESRRHGLGKVFETSAHRVESIDKGHKKGLMPQYDMQMEENIDRGHQESMMPQYDMQSDKVVERKLAEELDGGLGGDAGDEEAYFFVVGPPHFFLSSGDRTTMDEEYDVIVLGTGLKECILSGLLSVDGLKVLHMDRNDYYGGESTSLNLVQLWKKFRGSDKPPAHLGSSRDYNVDMIPKFMMANGGLVRVLIHTDVTKYLYFKAVDGSYVYNKGKIQKVPATDMEALKSPLMGLFEKRRARKFFIYVQDYEESDPKTHEGLDLTRVTTRQLIATLWTCLTDLDLEYQSNGKLAACENMGLDDNTVDFIGHALALHRDDRYLDEPALETVKKMKLYAESLARFQGGSPYIYPLYGLGELPQAFARLSAVYGGTYMLNKPECKVEFDEEGKACGVTSEGETARCKKVVCDPSYLPNKVRKVGKVARAICIMSHPIPNTNDVQSVQIILPQKQIGRKSDMYVFCCSYSHNVAPKGKYIAFVSTEAESDRPDVELQPGIALLGPVDEMFFDTYDRCVPVNEPSLDNCFISTSYDATTHFETTVQDVLAMYTSITGK